MTDEITEAARRECDAVLTGVKDIDDANPVLFVAGAINEMFPDVRVNWLFVKRASELVAKRMRER